MPWRCRRSRLWDAWGIEPSRPPTGRQGSLAGCALTALPRADEEIDESAERITSAPLDHLDLERITDGPFGSLVAA